MRRTLILSLLISVVVVGVGGCTATPEPVPSISTIDAETILEGGAFDGYTGQRLLVETVIARLRDADVIILGETHDDANAHALQHLLTVKVLSDRPGGALALEMLERDEQVYVDDYLDGFIDEDELAALTSSESWAGQGTWAAWYQPILDAAELAGARIVAANAPRRYVALARTDGYGPLRALPSERAGFVTLPDASLDGRYAERFREIMTGMADDGVHMEMSDEDIAKLYRSQLVWDATMADSVAQARRAGLHPVILLIGQFHSDFEGGTTAFIREARPGDVVLTVSLRPIASDALLEDDQGRADIVIYTGGS